MGKKLAVLLLLCSAVVLFAEQIYFAGDSEKSPLSYRCGEEIVFRISLLKEKKKKKGVPIQWNLFGEDGKRRKGNAVSDPEKPLVIRTSLSKPGFVYLEAKATDAKGNALKGALPLSISAGAKEKKIRQTVPEPKDFDAFWARQKARLKAVPMEVKLTPVPSNRRNVDCWMFEIKSVGKYPATGYLSMPKNAGPGSLKAVVNVYGYGFGSVPKQDQLAERGMLSLSISRHGLPQGKEPKFYTEQSRGAYKGFGFRNNETPENCDFNWMILRDLRAIEYLKSRPEWNGKDLRVSGGSMGAFQAINIAALEPAVNAVSASIPWCANLGGVKEGRLGGWRPAYTPALDYFDIVNQAKRIRCPVTISIGLGDRVCPASGQFAMYNGMTCRRTLTAEQSAGHRKASPNSRKYTIHAEAE